MRGTPSSHAARTAGAVLVALALLAPALGAQAAQTGQLAGGQPTDSVLVPAVTLAGIVRDDADRPLAGAEVRAGEHSVITGRDGAFVLRGLAPDTIALFVRRIGYRPADVAVVAQPGVRVQLEVRLVPAPFELGTITVEGRRMDTAVWRTGFYSREALGFGHFFDGEKLSRHFGTISTLLQDVPNIQVQRDLSGRAIPMGRSATGTCILNVFLDGQRIPWVDQSGLDLVANRDDILAVEVYPRPTEVPGIFASYGLGTVGSPGIPGPDGTRHRSEGTDCGAMLIWTKSSTFRLTGGRQ